MNQLILILCLVLLPSLASAESLQISNLSHTHIKAIDNAWSVLQKTKTFTGFDTDVGDLKIVVEPTRGDLNIVENRIQDGFTGFVACYELGTNTIYTYPGVKAVYLAHEFTHVLTYKFFGKHPPKQMEEVYPNYVEQNIDLGWDW